MADKINKQHRVIYNNDYYNDENITEARLSLAEANDCSPEEVSQYAIDDLLSEWDRIWVDDERANLNIDTGGCIVGYCDLGFWDGRRTGLMIVGENVRDILNSNYSCDYVDFYCDRYNVRFSGSHHDGSHRILFRMVESKDAARRMLDRFADGGYEMSEDEFRKKTKSIRKFVANVFGW